MHKTGVICNLVTNFVALITVLIATVCISKRALAAQYEGEIIRGLPVYDSEWKQVEVTATSRGSRIVVGIGEIESSWKGPMRCVFLTSSNGGKKFGKPLIIQSSKYPITLNPTAIIDSKGRIHVACLSAQPDYSGGSLVYASSADGGKTWTEPREIASRLDGILDKPWLYSGQDGSLSIAYIDMPAKPLAAVPTFLISKDNGKTWVKELAAPTLLPSDPGSIGFQGPWLSAVGKNNLGMSFGQYQGGPIYFCLSDRLNALCKSPVEVAQSKLPIPVTQFVTSSDGKKIAVLWYSAHGTTDAFIAVSLDQGKSWQPPFQVSSNGVMPAILMKNDLLMVLNTEFTSSEVRVSADIYGLSGKLQRRSDLAYYKKDTSPIDSSQMPYIGAYQSLIQTKCQQVAFYINYQDSRPKVFAAASAPAPECAGR